MPTSFRRVIVPIDSLFLNDKSHGRFSVVIIVVELYETLMNFSDSKTQLNGGYEALKKCRRQIDVFSSPDCFKNFSLKILNALSHSNDFNISLNFLSSVTALSQS